MENLLLMLIILILSVLVGVVIMLSQTIIRLKKIEQAALERTQAQLQDQSNQSLPAHMDQMFNEVLTKHRDYLDELLRISITSFDKRLHSQFEASLQNQLKDFNQAINAQQQLAVEQMSKLSGSIKHTDKHLSNQLQQLTTLIQKQYEKQLGQHYTEIAWKYINDSLAENADLYSQKEAIFKQLKANQKKLKQDFKHVD